MLLIGSSGTGKTLMCETLSRFLDVPFVTAEATSLANTRFVNEEIEAMLTRLVDKAGGSVEKAEAGIVFIDEIDKLKSPGGQAQGSSGESVQHSLLKIMEGAQVKLAGGRYMDTTDILFICGGAFVGLDDIIGRRRTATGSSRRPRATTSGSSTASTPASSRPTSSPTGSFPSSPDACRSSRASTISTAR